MEQQFSHKLNKEFTMDLRVTWKYIYIGYKGYERIMTQLSKEDIIQYGYHLLEESSYNNELVAQLIGNSQDNYEFDRILEKLQKTEDATWELEVRKWTVCLANEMINKLPDDYMEGLFEINEFWISLGQPSNCPHIYQAVDNDIGPKEYYTQKMFDAIMQRHKEWIAKEVCEIKNMEIRK